MPCQPLHHDDLLPQLVFQLVCQVGADHEEGYGGDRQRDRGHGGGHRQGEARPQRHDAARRT